MSFGVQPFGTAPLGAEVVPPAEESGGGFWLPDSRLMAPALLEPGRKPATPVEIDWEHKYAKDLALYMILNDTRNLADNTAGTFTGDAYIDPSKGLECDGNGDTLVFSAATRKALAFGTNDFTILVKFRYETGGGYPTLISNGDTGSGEWMLRVASGLSFYGDAGGIAFGTSNSMVNGAVYFGVVRQEGANCRVRLYDADFVELGFHYATTSDRDLNAENANACLGGGDANTNRWWKGGIEWAIALNGTELSEEQCLDLIRNPYQFLRPKLC